VTGRYDCCPGGGHREDELCSRTSVQTLPTVDDLIGMAVLAVAIDGSVLTLPDHQVTAVAGPDADGTVTLTVERPLSPAVTKWLGLPETDDDRGGAT
jgi:hypothetical protein